MSKADRKNKLLIIEGNLAIGIRANNQHHILEAYRHLEDLLSDAGVFRLSELPKFPEVKHDTNK